MKLSNTSILLVLAAFAATSGLLVESRMRLDGPLRIPNCSDTMQVPVVVQGIGFFCVDGPACAGEILNGKCPGPDPEGGLPQGSTCQTVEDGVFGCVPNGSAQTQAQLQGENDEENEADDESSSASSSEASTSTSFMTSSSSSSTSSFSTFSASSSFTLASADETSPSSAASTTTSSDREPERQQKIRGKKGNRGHHNRGHGVPTTTAPALTGSADADSITPATTSVSSTTAPSDTNTALPGSDASPSEAALTTIEPATTAPHPSLDISGVPLVATSFPPLATANSMSNGLAALIVQQTSAIRAWHGLGAVTWDAALAAKVQAYANTCPGFKHSSLGWENLASMSGTCTTVSECKTKSNPVWMWYDTEETKWDYQAKQCQNGDWATCGHFSNMMSPGVQAMGCGASDCGNGQIYVWCDYVTPDGDFPAIPQPQGSKAELCSTLSYSCSSASSFSVEDPQSVVQADSTQPTTTASRGDGNGNSSGFFSTGVIVGTIVGAVALIGLTVLAVKYRRHRRQEYPRMLTPGSESTIAYPAHLPATLILDIRTPKTTRADDDM